MIWLSHYLVFMNAPKDTMTIYCEKYFSLFLATLNLSQFIFNWLFSTTANFQHAGPLMCFLQNQEALVTFSVFWLNLL